MYRVRPAGSSGVSYHLNLTVPSLSVPGYGTWPCPPSGTAGVTAQQTAPPGTYINIQATEEATFCDVFYIEDGYSQECEAIGNGTALDGTGRELASSVFPTTVQVEGALTQAYWSGAPAPSCSTSLLGTRCSYAVKTNCTTATTPPDYNVGIINSGDYVGTATYVSWISAAACIRFNIAGPWICTPGLSFINSMNVVMPPYACTYNP
jgi:hypothetical protein